MERENIARAAKGDANAFETLMGAYEKKIYALCLRMMGNPHDGEDAAQEAMLRIWRTIGQYRFESAFSTWVYRVTAFCCMDAIRKRQRHEQPSLEEMGEASGFDPADGGETPQEQTERKETRSAIQQAIAAVLDALGEEELTEMILNLREPYCTPCRLVLLEQHTMAEAARLCGRPPKTVEAQVYRAKKMLAQQILQNDRIPCERRSVHGTV